ncbi:hypothetical protein ARHIZOSPH14_27380 [Agromyces rhizosphaerae]|uniref:Uncharacterized protein n=1 Tax=Agromyces rhizosphaerae TaxID=88374 RepID=A0A9W6CT32_9MICO|nr:hypothetical protein [Agromyces rhizosphaerae]GLI28496.1 hypothetical protein ARHIZOSPH14_27380 [Agromyces rhizosphaerae]
MTPEQLREELARTIEGLRTTLTGEELADAVLTSPAIASIKADAWDEGFRAGHRHARLRY